jgi:signal transduction histidine kinase
MSRIRGLAGRGRRLVGVADWPLAAGAFLGLVALLDTALRGEQTGADLVTAMLLGLGATVPLALARTHIVVAAAALAAATALTGLADQRPTGAGLVALAAAGFLLGRRALRRIRRGAVAREASRQAAAETLLAHAARGERARIARELHDVVAHHLSMISVQAETARLTTPGLPPEGAKRLLAIGDTARAALTEMRRLLGVLREDAGTEPVRAPQPGLGQVVELVDGARDSAGAGVRLIVAGRVRPLDPGVELTAYRIIQEALTNARRHAPGAAVDVELSYARDALQVRVRDLGPGPGPGPGPTGGGHGLLGMRERVAAVGGELRIGAGPAGGFLVEARLPAAPPPPEPVEPAVRDGEITAGAGR